MNKVITIDGPSSSGKTSVGYQFSRQIGYDFVDAGTLYRAGCVRIIELGSQGNDPDLNADVFESLDINFLDEQKRQRVLLSGIDITELINSVEVTTIVPIVGSASCVRSVVKRMLYNFSTESNIVITGRDIGTEIFPNAFLKFFLTASPEVRAIRRHGQLVLNGDNTIGYELVLSQILYRDEMDSRREISPMRIPEDAIIINSSYITIDKVLSIMDNELNLREMEFLNNA